MSFPMSSCSPVLLLAYVSVAVATATSLGANESITDARSARVTGRIVKVYSGSKPEPIVCVGEGYQVDPSDCAVFYRCVKSNKEKFTVFRFQCGPGTIYDPETEVCNHPKSTKRSECNGFIPPDNLHHEPGHEGENEVDSSVASELPSPIKVNKPAYVDHNTVKRDDVSSTAIPWISSTLQTSSAIKLSSTSSTMSFKPATKKSDQQVGDKCTSDGFMGDSKNCHVFYRCVGNGRGGFTRYQFSCSDDTVWDDDVQSCNYPSFVKRSRCGRSSDIAKVNSGTQQKSGENSGISTIQPQTQLDYGSKVTQIKPQMNNGMGIPDKTQINYSQRVDQNQIQENFGLNNNQNQKQIINDDSTVSQTQVQMSNRNKAAQNQVQDNNTKQASQQQQTISYGLNDDESTSNNNNQNKPQESTMTKSSESNNRGNDCTSSGFKGDYNDCKKFYRCVDNGRGSFTRYEFSCGDGTVWDSSIEACNHEWAVKSCGQKAPTEASSSTISVTSEATSTTAVTKTTTRPQITTEQLTTDNEDEDTPYGNQNQGTSTTNKPTTVSPSSQGTTEGSKTEGTKCTQSGFMGDSSDCKKFYRCVDNGKGSYTRYEFTCGEGTVWDPEIDGCNHAWAVSKCGGSSTNVNQIMKTTTTTTTVRDDDDQLQVTSKPTSSSSQTTDNDVEDNDSGYGQFESSKAPSSTVTTQRTEPQQQNKNSTCKASGFMGDAQDCKKFYRCVDNGNGEYIRYEFSCGEGTVWDNSIDACNHAWAVKSCETGADQSSQTQTEVATQEITTSESTISEISHTYPETSSSVFESTSTTQIPPKSPESGNECTSEGFKGDRSDCKKFYRCVDNGKGSYTKYEFTCGEGTVWDSEIQGCNHQTSNNRCGNSQTSPTTIIEQTSQQPEMENDEVNTDTTSKTTTDSSHTSTTEKPQFSSSKCDSEGFYGNPNDCTKFYRCVDDGKGGYIKYDFNCGEGTVWDQEIQACNHPKERQNCTQSSSSTSQTTEAVQENTGESHETITTTSKTETSTPSSTTTLSLSNQGKCSSEGFFANPGDCKKFYRCVNDGKGGYTKYDFACGEGTVWVQEIQACDHDNEVNSCSAQNGPIDQQMNNEESSSTKQPQTSKQPNQQSTGTSTFTTTESQTQANQIPIQSSTGSTPTNSGECNYEGFYANENDCTKFYRCVENGKGGYTKYDFACGEGTAWDSNIQACNHAKDVNCNINSSGNQDKPETQQDETVGSTESTGATGGTGTTESTTKTSTSGPSSQSSESTGSSMSDDECTKEGYFGNNKDCKKFYRCVDNGKGTYTKYDFDCGEGTIWDQDITACNHPRDVNNPSCKDGDDSSSSSSTTTTSSTPESSAQTTTQSSSQSTSSSTTESNGQESSNCSQENTSKKPENKSVNCTKEGFYGDPDDCKKFYRCVDWDGNGQRFSVYHFECGEGTIWDPSLDTCNHEDSVYPSRDCSGTQDQSANVDNESSTTESTTTKQGETTTTGQVTTAQSQTTTTKEQSSTTEQQSATQESTTQSTTSKQTTTQKSTTQESTTTEQTTTTTTTEQGEKTTTQPSPTEKSTTEQVTSGETTSQQSTTERTTTQHSTTEQTTTQQSTTSEQTTTQESNTSEQSTTEQSNSSDQTTTEQTTTGEPSTTEQSNSTEESTTQQSGTEQSSESTTQSSTTQESTTQQEQGSTTESQESTTTEGSTESPSQKECPDTESEQYLYVCPTGFRRHPKYCNLFYQCTEDDDTHEVKIATFTCPNNTIYDENKTQCVEENKAEKKCNGEIAQKRRFKRLDADAPQPMVVSKQRHSCPSAGHYPFEKEDECSPAFLKCEKTKSEKIRGFVYRCPNNFVYWAVSRRCEPVSKLRNCKESVNDWSKRYEIPVERSNVAR